MWQWLDEHDCYIRSLVLRFSRDGRFFLEFGWLVLSAATSACHVFPQFRMSLFEIHIFEYGKNEAHLDLVAIREMKKHE
jgi:hypothetical protein